MDFSLEQKTVIELKKGNYLLLACAGSGKTTVLVERFMSLKTEYHKILCLTFSNAAAQELLSRIKVKVPYISSPWIGTFHGIAFRLLQIYQIIDSGTKIIDEYGVRNILSSLNITHTMDTLYEDNQSYEYHKYQEYCHENKRIDFKNIMQVFLSTLQNNVEFKTQIQKRFEYIIVDEYQDTSEEQMKILSIICNNNLMVVGDDDQAIYEWRGAEIKNILEFHENFENVKIFYLSDNYRSTIPIVYSSNQVISRNKKRYQKNMFTQKKGDLISLYACNYKSTSQVIYDLIQKYKLNKEIKTIGILCRLSSIVRKIEASLISWQVPLHQKRTTKGIIHNKKVKIILSYLSFLCCDNTNFLNIVLQNPRRGIGPKKLQKILSHNDIWSGIEIEIPLEYKKLVDIKRDLRAKITIEDKIVYLSKHLEISSNYEPLVFLREMSREYSELNNFVQDIMFGEKVYKPSISTQIMTIHAAKGLEFDAVIIADCIEGIFPCINAIHKGTLEEERRLMYVAMTRAKKILSITYDLRDCKRNFFGISRFIMDIPPMHSRKFIE